MGYISFTFVLCCWFFAVGFVASRLRDSELGNVDDSSFNAVNCHNN